MKITVVLGAFFPVPPTMGGAVEKAWFALSREFAGRGHEVTMISRSMPDLASEETVDGIRHTRVRGFDTPRSLLWLKALDFLYSLRARRVLPAADILVTNTFWLPMLVRDSSRGKIYVHVGRYPKGQMRFYHSAARLQAPSSEIANAIAREAPALASKTIAIPYPRPQVERESASPPLDAREKNVLFVGRVHPEKGVHLLVEAFARPHLNPLPGGEEDTGRGCLGNQGGRPYAKRQVRGISAPGSELADWKLMIVGPSEVKQGGGGESYVDKMRGAAGNAAIEFCGPIFDEAKLAAVFRRAQIFVYPSLAARGETFGLAPLEAMSHGCAVIVSNLDCFRDFIVPNETGFVFDQNAADPAESLANALRFAVTDSIRLTRIAAAGLRKSEEFSLARVADKFLRDFGSLCSDGSPTGKAAGGRSSATLAATSSTNAQRTNR
jgi:glycosyltransferase involved in cell wall biosynthesis